MYVEYPKALYTGADLSGYAVADGPDQETQLRAQGFLTLPEWFKAEAEGKPSTRAAVQAKSGPTPTNPPAHASANPVHAATPAKAANPGQIPPKKA